MRVLGSLSGSKSYLLATLQTTIASRFLPCTSCDATRQLTARSSSWTSQKIRTSYIDYFRDQHRHDYYPPSSIIPPKGSGTFFTNAGMNQFKSIFLGTVSADSPLYSLKRAVNSQKCIRLSGKHNDLDDVGHDTTHHTFFEMLGNWSFGDYFKKEAIVMAWELMTKVYMIPEDRLYVTYFGGDQSLSLEPDLETRDLWLMLGLPAYRVIPGNTKDNFWEMGDTGPCGPCSEIHYDFIGGRDASSLVNTDNPDVVELWNLVFIQHNRLGTNELELLPHRHVDTGMGLERLVSVLQHKRSNYDTDLFTPIISTLQQSSLCGPYGGRITSEADIAYRIVSDHARMMCISISNGVRPAPDGLDGLCSKLRSIMQRMFKYQRKSLSCPPMSSCQLVDPVVDTLGEAFPELSSNYHQIKEVVMNEEDRYYELLSDYYSMMGDFIRRYPDMTMFSSEEWLRFKDINPDVDLSAVELLSDVAKDYGVNIDHNLLNVEETEGGEPHIHVAVKSPSHDSKLLSELRKSGIAITDDSRKYGVKFNSNGKYEWSNCDGKVLAILRNEKMIHCIENSDMNADDTLMIVTDKTCFYSEMGGQAADSGTMKSLADGSRLSVIDVQYQGQHVIHTCKLEEGGVSVGHTMYMSVDQDRRTACALNHTATHLLNHSLRSIDNLSDSEQAGSSVTPDELSFSLTCKNPITSTDLQQISSKVNQLINLSVTLTTRELPYTEVQYNSDIIRLPTHQYPSRVRVVGVGDLDNALNTGERIDFSAELCGGTHVVNTRDIQSFVITGLAGQYQPVKKITAITGQRAVQSLQLMSELTELAQELIRDVHSDVEKESWETRYKRISQLHGKLKEYLPKVEREALMSDLEQKRIRELITAHSRQGAKQNLQSTVEQLLADGSSAGVVVGQVDFTTPRDVSKILRRLSPVVPVCVYNESEKPTIICYNPSIKNINWLHKLSEMTGGNLQQSKGKNMSNLFTMKLGAQPDIEIKQLVMDSLAKGDDEQQDAIS